MIGRFSLVTAVDRPMLPSLHPPRHGSRTAGVNLQFAARCSKPALQAGFMTVFQQVAFFHILTWTYLKVLSQ